MATLIPPTATLREAWTAAHREWGPGLHEDGFGLGPQDTDFDTWIARLTSDDSCTYRWIVDSGQVVGGIALRHEDSGFGHIGFGIRPSARRRGFATWALREMLNIARSRGMSSVVLVCADGNTASERTITSCGGIFERAENGGRWFTIPLLREPSKTAIAVAYSRAYHRLHDKPIILDDPLAARLLGIADDVEEPDSADPEWRRVRRLVIASRARFAEDTIVEVGAAQVVILGAGLDTYGYRNPGQRVFEVDHPGSQGWKRDRIAAAGIAVPGSLTFVPVDFERDSLAECLTTAGMDRSVPTVYVWLGVVMYLSGEAIEETLSYIGGHEAPAWVVIDYLQPPPESGRSRAAVLRRADRVAAVGEPWRSFFEPDQMADLLQQFGFTDVDNRDGLSLVRGYGVADIGAHPTASTPPHVVRAFLGK